MPTTPPFSRLLHDGIDSTDRPALTSALHFLHFTPRSAALGGASRQALHFLHFTWRDALAPFRRGQHPSLHFLHFTHRAPGITALLLGILAALGFAPLQLWPLTLVALTGWIALVAGAPTARAALWRGWAFGVGHFTINDNWFQHAFDFQDRMPPALGYLAPLALALYLAVYPAAAAALAWRVTARSNRRANWPFVLILAACWIGSEYARARLFTGYAWDPLGVVWVATLPAARIAAWTGTYALSGLTLLVAGALLLLLRDRSRAAVGVLAGFVLAAAATGLQADPPAATGPTRLRVVQPNIGLDPDGGADPDRLYAALAAGSGRPGPAPRLLLWPEGVLRDLVEDGYPFDWYRVDPRYARWRLARLLGPRDLLLAGGDALRFDPRGNIAGAANSVFVVDSLARLPARYDKAHLVPYGEYLPMPWLLKPLGLARLVPGDVDFDPGPGPRTLDLPGFGAVGVQVCYEIIFSGEVIDRAHRPRLLFNPSNDAWFGRWGPPQHLAQARMRAIEEGVPIVRATPTGISAAIDARGRLLGQVPHEQAGAIELPVPQPLPPTLFARLGNWAAALVALALVAAGVAVRRRPR